MPYEATMAARMVLGDCRYALTELRIDPQGAAWRVRWCGTLVLLRAVWHVLGKEAKKSCPEIRKAYEEWNKKLGNKKPDPPIYWKFIVDYRNNILKEYELGAEQSVTVRPGVKKYDLRTGQEETVAPSGPTTTTYKMRSKMRGGPFDGQDAHDVVEKAIEWWEQQLAGIEADALARSSGKKSSP
jgi:hypothetical protein